MLSMTVKSEEPSALPAPASGSHKTSVQKSLVRLRLCEWETLAYKGYGSVLNRVEELWWVPVLYDEGPWLQPCSCHPLFSHRPACRDKATFWKHAKHGLRAAIEQMRKTAGNVTAAELRARELDLINRAHKPIMQAIEVQQKLMHAARPHEQLRAAVQSARRLRTLVIRPTRLSPHEPKPEHLNVYAFTSIIGALTPHDDHPPRGITTLRVFDVDLCALLACAPCSPYAPPLAVDAEGHSFFLPPLLRSWHDMHMAWCEVVRDLEALQCAFLRPDAFEPRLEQMREEAGETLEAQMLRTTEVLRVCRDLKELKLAFHYPLSVTMTPPQSSTSRALQPAVCDSQGEMCLPPRCLSPSPAGLPLPGIPVELDICFILPYCDVPTVPGSNFQHLREFALSTVVLYDSSALFYFLRNHSALEVLGLENVGHRYGPAWSDPEVRL